MKTKRTVISLFIVTVFSLLTGCYTVIEHPDLVNKDENGYTYSSKVYFYDDCASCHTEKEMSSFTKQERLAMEKAHAPEDNNGSYYFGDQYYYQTEYYGDYGYYYNYPWWYTVNPPEQHTRTKTRDIHQDQAIEYNGRGRNNDGGRGDSPTTSAPTPTRSSNGGSSSGSGSTSTSVDNNQGQQNRSSSSSSDNRNSSEQPKSRNNDGNRSSNSGRR
ncbi:MAG: hypothetical protein ACM3S2_06020 [Ignavibacteriales bacterium]